VRAGDAVGAGGCRRTVRVECERERVGIAREEVEEDEEEAASEQRRCQCARGRRVGPGVGVTSRRNRTANIRPHRRLHRLLISDPFFDVASGECAASGMTTRRCFKR